MLWYSFGMVIEIRFLLRINERIAEVSVPTEPKIDNAFGKGIEYFLKCHGKFSFIKNIYYNSSDKTSIGEKTKMCKKDCKGAENEEKSR